MRNPDYWEAWLRLDPLGEGGLAFCCLSVLGLFRLGTACTAHYEVVRLAGGPFRKAPWPVSVHEHALTPDDILIEHGLHIVRPAVAIATLKDEGLDDPEAIEDGLDEGLIRVTDLALLRA
ncbi:MAG: hypothetical protein ACYDH5_04565 [Acidimicrobiales bacterium]